MAKEAVLVSLAQSDARGQLASSIEDFERFGHRRGQAAGQQTWECLAALVALRCWTKFWRNHRVRLTVRGDSVAMLTMLCLFKY